MPAAGLQLLWLVVALSQLPRSLCFTCSEGCKCIWRGGKMYGECPLLELSALPSGMDENLQVLNLTHNLIRALPKHAFVNAGLINVQRLYLSRCELSHIDDSALFKVTNLIELDLSDNKLSAVPTAALSSTPKLKSLNLNRNPITALADMAFSDLTELTHLEMTECRLESVSAGAFEGLSNLKVLKLDHNLLETMPGRAMAPFSLLHEIALDGNRWRCDCELRAFRMWLERNNISHYSPTCHKPLRLSSKPWKSLSSEDMACPPAFVNASSSTSEEVVVVHENSNVTLKCRARADPPAEISWLWKDKPLSNQSEPGQAFVLTQEPGDRERLSWLTLRFVQEPLAGLYACVAQNAAGRVVRNFTLEVTKRTTEGRPSAGGGVTAEVEMTEQARESTELQQRSYAENPVLGMVIGILVGALAVLVVFGLTLWLCRRRGRRRGAPLGSRKRTEANSNHKALHNDKQQQQSQPATDDAADVKLLVNPIQKPPRLLMTNSYHQGLPSELEPLDPGLCVESSSGVWVVKEHDYSTDESVLSSIPSRAGTIDRRSLARSPIPVPMPVVPPTDDLHARLHGELTDTLRRTKGDRRPLVERADAQSPLEPYAGLETLRVRDLEHRGPDLIDQIGAAQPPSPRWTPYEHPSAYYRATAGTPQSCYPPSIPEAPADGTEV